MKSTYLLVGAYLDGLDIAVNIPLASNIDDYTQWNDVSVEYNLFDYPVCNRRISVMELLDCIDKQEMEKFIGVLDVCSQLVVVVDCISSGDIVRNFLIRRILQLIKLIQNMYPKLKIIAVAETGKIYAELSAAWNLYQHTNTVMR